MKLRRRIGIGLAVAAATYCVLACIFMWPPVVRYYWNWHRSTSSADACINNLRQIDAAINQFAHEHHKKTGDPVTLQDITPYIKLNAQVEIPKCYTGHSYILTVVGEPPRCPQFTNTTEPAIIRVGYFHWDENGWFHIYHNLP